MVRLVGMAVLCAATLLSVDAAHAQTPNGRASGHPRLQTVTFKVHVSGDPASTSTFWVAHGPLGGRFGIVQLTPAGSGTFAATLSLPVSGRTTFTFLEGTGRRMTRMGAVPGDPVVTISTIGSATAAVAARRVVQWYAPIG